MLYLEIGITDFKGQGKLGEKIITWKNDSESCFYVKRVKYEATNVKTANPRRASKKLSLIHIW